MPLPSPASLVFYPAAKHRLTANKQSNIWTALSAEGAGANLQHYNPLIDAKVADTWGIPASWKLNAQIVFGGKTGDADPKDKKPDEEVFKSFGA